MQHDTAFSTNTGAKKADTEARTRGRHSQQAASALQAPHDTGLPARGTGRDPGRDVSVATTGAVPAYRVRGGGRPADSAQQRARRGAHRRRSRSRRPCQRCTWWRACTLGPWACSCCRRGLLVGASSGPGKSSASMLGPVLAAAPRVRGGPPFSCSRQPNRQPCPRTTLLVRGAEATDDLAAAAIGLHGGGAASRGGGQQGMGSLRGCPATRIKPRAAAGGSNPCQRPSSPAHLRAAHAPCVAGGLGDAGGHAPQAVGRAGLAAGAGAARAAALQCAAAAVVLGAAHLSGRARRLGHARPCHREALGAVEAADRAAGAAPAQLRRPARDHAIAAVGVEAADAASGAHTCGRAADEADALTHALVVLQVAGEARGAVAAVDGLTAGVVAGAALLRRRAAGVEEARDCARGGGGPGASGECGAGTRLNWALSAARALPEAAASRRQTSNAASPPAPAAAPRPTHAAAGRRRRW
jgi:hypothetical protein